MSNDNSSDEELDAQARLDAKALKEQIAEADSETLRLLFTEARSHNGWRDKPVAEETLRRLYDIMKFGPTSMNQQPLRIVFVQSQEAKEKLKPALSEGNVAKTMAAPVCAILGYDLEFYKELPKIFPPAPNAWKRFAENPEGAELQAFRNGTLQAAYFMIAARAVGLDVGPMGGFDAAKVDESFLAGTTIKSNFLCNLGYADETKIFRRLPRLTFDEVAKIL